MSEIQHPRFSGDRRSNPDLMLQFAEEAFNLLIDHGVITVNTDEYDAVDGYAIITPRYDCPTDEKSVYASVRLRELDQAYMVHQSIQSNGTDAEEYAAEESSYAAILLQTAEFNDITLKNLDKETDEIKKWKDYIAIIFEVNTDEKNISIVNAATGAELSFDDLVEAYSVFCNLKSYLLSERFESHIARQDYELMYDTYEDIEQKPLTEIQNVANASTSKYIKFNPSHHLFDFECPKCGKPGALCTEHANQWKS